jgi:hypothetical protein
LENPCNIFGGHIISINTGNEEVYCISLRERDLMPDFETVVSSFSLFKE